MTEEIKNNKLSTQQQIYKDYGILARSSLYSFLNTYGTFIFSVASSFILARLIDDASWSYFTIALSYIQIISLILKFLPPSLTNTLYYYIPRYNSLNQKSELKAFILRGIFLKLIFLIPMMFFSIFAFSFLADIFSINLTYENIFILFLLSPLIIINNMHLLFNAINIGFNRFRLNFILVIFQYSSYIGFLLYYFIFFQSISLESLSIAYVIATLIPFIINIIINSFKIYQIKTTKKSVYSFKQDFQKIVKYGGLVRSAIFFSDIWGEIQVQSIGVFEPNMVLGFKISRDLLSVSVNASLAISYPLTVSFSGFIATEKKEKIISIYNLLNKYIIFLIQVITGILFFCTDFFIVIIYGEARLIYSDVVHLYLFTFIFLILASPLDSLLLAENKVKYMVFIRFMGLCIRLPIFLFLIINFDLYFSIWGIILSNFIFSVLYILLTMRVGGIKLFLKKIFIQYLLFFIALGLTLILEHFFLNNFNSMILNVLGLSFFSSFNFFSLLTFLITYFILVIVFKVLTISDIDNLQSFLIKEKKIHNLTNKFLNFIKKIIKIFHK